METAVHSKALKEAPSARGETQRRCAVTRAHLPKAELIRFVRGPDGAIVPDLKERLPGRGVWLTATHETVAKAVKRRAFGHALKADVSVPENLAQDVDTLLTENALGAFALANKAGELVFGHAKVEDALQKGQTIALVHAADAAGDGCRKLDGKARAATAGKGLPAVSQFTADELGLASGRTNVIHAALIQGGAARNFLAAASRVERYREANSAFADRHGLDTEQE
ncbi:MAG: RNA-binding protein [Pseudomonadota bacterium]